MNEDNKRISKLLSPNSKNYNELQELILSWINDTTYVNNNEWPEIEEEIRKNRIKFSDDMISAL